ncbi:MAG TPA: electron transfer flavoprotein subunit alpha/FixB family protein [Dehalococcoidia bacterium]|nr:electron transfer flavoprotein subunit alpha/FixB family protein [Dehalococcoidia bacterium]
MPGVLVFSEKDEFALDLLPKSAALAKQLEMELNVAILGPAAKSRATQYFARGASKAYISENELFTEFDAKVQSQALFEIAEVSQAEIMLLVSTKRGKEIASSLAQMLGAGCITNALDIKVEDSKLVASRYGLGGTTIVSEYIETPKKVIAVIPQTFETIEVKSSDGQVIDVDLKLDKPEVKVIERKERKRESVDIEKTDVLICVGLGLKQKEDLGLIQELANAVGGEIGCSRDLASSLGWLSEDRIVGMSGKRCKPKVVFSIGISGQSQHVAGIVGAKTIAAINNDKNAPIFRVADYGILADLYEAVPLLTKRLHNMLKS